MIEKNWKKWNCKLLLRRLFHPKLQMTCKSIYNQGENEGRPCQLSQPLICQVFTISVIGLRIDGVDSKIGKPQRYQQYIIERRTVKKRMSLLNSNQNQLTMEKLTIELNVVWLVLCWVGWFWLVWGVNVWDENWGRWIMHAPVFERL